MNHLNNNQLILLAILVSFVTSIATGIVTVTLIDQAPLAVTQTIDRVVERTVEIVVPGPGRETIIKERVVVDKGGELVVAAVEKASPAVADVYSILNVVEKDKPVFEEENEENSVSPKEEGVGFFIDENGLLLTLFEFVEGTQLYIGVSQKNGGRVFLPLSLVKRDNNSGLALFRVIEDEVEEESVKTKWPALQIAEEDAKVGQTAIVLDPGIVAVSFISGLIKNEDKPPFYKLYLDEKNTLEGRPVISVKEEVIGILQEGNELLTAESINRFLTEDKEEMGGGEEAEA